MKNKQPVLFIFSGLPGVGKSTLAKRLVAHCHGVFLRIDTIEQGIRDLCAFKVEGEGYRLSYRIARDNLLLGNSVIADCTNSIQLTRHEWEQVATDASARYINIEVLCSDTQEHQHRVETRENEVKNLQLPDWEEVQNREFDAWEEKRIVIDTAQKNIDTSWKELHSKIGILV